MREREDLCGVGERHRSLARAVERREQEDEERNHADMRPALPWDVEAESGCEKTPRHLWESEQEESATSKSINGPDLMRVVRIHVSFTPTGAVKIRQRGSFGN